MYKVCNKNKIIKKMLHNVKAAPYYFFINKKGKNTDANSKIAKSKIAKIIWKKL